MSTPVPAALAQIASSDTAEQPTDDTWRVLTTRNAERLLARSPASPRGVPGD